MQTETLRAVLDLCENRGWRKPTGYQGNYNLITRGMEARSCQFCELASSPITPISHSRQAFPTGKLVNNQHAGSRFEDENPLSEMARKAFGAAELHHAMKAFDTKVKAFRLSPLEVAIRWIAHHSALSNENGIILGASKTPQVSETVEMLRKGPLPANVLDLTEELWDTVKAIRGQNI